MLAAFLIIPSSYSQETLTITTYYPAPFGVYTNLRLFPSGQPACAANDEGTMYYDNNTRQVMVCGQDAAGNPAWQGVGLWTRNGNNVFLGDLNWNVGIGVNPPVAKLDVNGEIKIGNSGLICDGNTPGAMRYNVDRVEFCDGSTWRSVGGKPTISDQFVSTITTWGGATDQIISSNPSDWDACYLESYDTQIDDETVVDEADDQFKCEISKDSAGWHLISYYDRHTTHNIIERNKGTVTCKARCLKW